jgi:acetyltransferase
MTGSDDVLDAALRQNGVLRVDTIEELFDMAEVLSKQPLPAGPRLAIVTNAGGPGALATDAVVLGGGTLAELSALTLEALNAILPAAWSHQNPVDVLGDADAARYAKALQLVAHDENVDGVLAVLTPQAMTHPAEIAREVATLSKASTKPLLASWMGAQSVQEGRAILNAARLPTYDYPDEGAQAFVRMHEHRERLDWLRDTQAALKAENGHHLVIDLPTASGLLNEVQAKNLLQAAGIPVVPTREALSENEAVSAAEAIGYPVVLKLLSPTITHKSDCGGVQLHLRDAAAVRSAWLAIQQGATQKHGVEAFAGVTVQSMIREKGVELILGMTRDAQFGPVLLLGAGGTLVEVLQDRALALPPINEALARRWMRGTKIFRVLQGIRGAPAVDFAALEQVLIHFARLATVDPRLMEIDINPLLAMPSGVMALDARVRVS